MLCRLLMALPVEDIYKCLITWNALKVVVVVVVVVVVFTNET